MTDRNSINRTESLSKDEQMWFEKLTAKRTNAVNVLRDEGLINVFVSHIVDTYRESAHFLYELIQNADDVQATKARFQLKDDGILFVHNGKIKFSITDPDVERKAGVTPGHINAITTFSLSTKKEEIENKIGKFGIGFKSVFQYTNTPFIYNPPFNFKIEEFMIPQAIESNSSLLKEDESTAFWLPFNKTDKLAEEAIREISDKIDKFNNPLLFLRNLTSIEISSNGRQRTFSKNIKEIDSLGLSNLKVKIVELDKDKIIRFDRSVSVTDKEDNSHNLPINIAFVIDKKGNISSEEKHEHYFQNAWCFFPTYQNTKLNYIINAPFILTPNREALKETRNENKQLLLALSELAETAIQALKALGYVNEHFFTSLPIPNNIPADFRIIAQKIISKLQAGEFIPSHEGDHIAVANAFVCTETLLADLLSYNDYTPLRKLTGKPQARIVFRERKLFDDPSLFVFFYQNLSATKSDLQSTWLGGQFNKSFLEEMPEEFDIQFFRYLNDRSSSILAKNQPLWKKQFIPVENGDDNYLLVAPNDSNGNSQVFIGGRKVSGRYTVAEYLSKDQEIKDFLTHILQFRTPDNFDDFFFTLDKYKEPDSLNRDEVFQDISEIIKYFFEESQQRKEKLIQKLKNLSFIPTITDDGSLDFSNPFKTLVYFPSNDLKEYFSKSKESKTWIDLAFNKGLYTNEKIKDFCFQIDIEMKPYYFNDKEELDGLSDFLEDITLSESVYLSDVLFSKSSVIDFTKDLSLLKESEWLFNSSAVKSLPANISSGDLHEKYSTLFNSIHISLGALVDKNEERYSKLSDVEKSLLEGLAPTLENLSPDEIKEALAEFLKKKNSQQNANQESIESQKDDNESSPEGLINSWTSEPLSNIKNRSNIDEKDGNTFPKIPKSSEFWNDEYSNVDNAPDNPGGFVSAPVIGNKYKEDQEKRKRGQLEKELELESKRNQLIELAHKLEPYSFGWFKALLELEDNFTAEDRVKKNPVRVVFTKAELDEDNLLVLSETPFIPANIEDIGEISIQLFFDDEKRTIKGEVVSPKKRTLKIKLSSPESVSSIDLTKVTRAIVEASSPDFILEKLKIAFSRLPFEDTDNLKKLSTLPSEIKFVFGPPGTGKTTYLSWLIGGKNPTPLLFNGTPITPLIEDESKRNKVLVLTPTNKAADVLVERILKNYDNTNEYPDWLIRFGQTLSLENEPLFVGDRILQPWAYDQCAMVTTIARFPYDRFKIERKDLDADEWFIKDFNWDYIIFDEASMIHQSAILYTILYAYQINPNVKFFIGGDPFQIPPIIQFEFPHWSFLPEPAFDNQGKPITDEQGTQIEWKQDGGNIYAFTGLMSDDSFKSPKPEPHKFEIHNLTTQFRSLPAIGSLFSNYRYNGYLQHHRNEGNISLTPILAEKPITIKGLDLKAINIIRFPVKRYEGIYRSRAVKGSPYQLYSALFTVELIKYIQANCSINNNVPYRIGVISPYAIQNNIVTKLLEKISSGPLEIITGTVHGFQGDECDLVIVILNPPRNITRSPRSFLNKKNILNVAISRARDKMILLTPHDSDNEVNVNDLHQIKWIEHLSGTHKDCKDHVQGFLATDIEKALWNSSTYIEDNSFPTTHQNVNIYRDAAKRYEIRFDENAIDIQVRD